MVVVAILSILLAILLPVYNRAKRQAQITDSLQRLHQLWAAVELYRVDEGGYPPILEILRARKSGSFYGTHTSDWSSGCGKHPSANSTIRYFLDPDPLNWHVPSDDPIARSDDKCNDPDIDLRALYVTKLGLGVRTSGTLEKRWGQGWIDSESFWQ